MDYKKLILYVALAIVAVQLWTAWQADYTKQPLQTSQHSASSTQPNNQSQDAYSHVPQLPQAKPFSMQTTTKPANRLVTVKTDLLDLTIDTAGGNIVQAKLLDYPASLKQKNVSFTLLNDNPSQYYVAESGLKTEEAVNQTPAVYQSTQNSYQLANGQQVLVVNLTREEKGVKFTKTFTFTRDSYVVDVKYNINNQSQQEWRGGMFTQLSRVKVEPKHSGVLHSMTFLGAAISSPDKRFEKLKFSELDKVRIDRQITGGWAAMVQHYFLSAWIPSATAPYHYYSNVDNNVYTIGMISNPIVVAAGSSKNISARLYTGPEITSRLKQVAPGLDLTVDYGIFWFISSIIFWLMQKIYSVVGNWGWSIVLVTVLIKLIFYKLSATSYRSMAKMRRLQPRIATLKERYGSDKQKFSQAMMELYKKEKVNPLGGCLPILIQIPVFIGLYWVLVESVQLRQAPFILWIHDLSAKDPYYILPILMGLSMFLQQKLSPTPPDPTQAKIMMLMPVVFTVLFATFPAGLVLYWLVNNVLSVLQQWYITQKLEKEFTKPKKQPTKAKNATS